MMIVFRSIGASFVAVSLALLVLGGCETLPKHSAPLRDGSAAAKTAVSSFEQDERTAELYLSAIAELIARQKFYAALAHLDEFERLHGQTAPSRKLRGDAWLSTGAIANARIEYAAIAEGQMAGYGKHGLGRVAAAGRDWVQAAVYFEEAVRSQPTNTQFLKDFGSSLFQLGRLDEAAFQYRKAIELSPGDRDANEALKAVLAASGRRGQALADAEISSLPVRHSDPEPEPEMAEAPER